MIDFDEIKLSYETFESLPQKLKLNLGVAELYDQLADESKNEVDKIAYLKYSNTAKRIKYCTTMWDVDYYRFHRLKDLVRTNRCRDKFCVNCQSQLAERRFDKFAPIISKLSEDYSVYHCIFTVPNCQGGVLKNVIKIMFKSFAYLIRYLKGAKKIKGYDFSKIYGYVGAVKSLEITHNIEQNTYHPHLHCLILFRKDLHLNKNIKNDYSYNFKNKDEINCFSFEEILIQKIWCLLNENKKVTKQSIEELSIGYSVKFNEAEKDDYKEVFKYALKNEFIDGKILTFETFKLYQQVLKNLRVIQGYGKLLCCQEDVELENAELDIAYQEAKWKIRELEIPVKVYEGTNEVLFNIQTNKYTYITSGTLKKYVIELNEYLTKNSEVKNV